MNTGQVTETLASILSDYPEVTATQRATIAERVAEILHPYLVEIISGVVLDVIDNDGEIIELGNI